VDSKGLKIKGNKLQLEDLDDIIDLDEKEIVPIVNEKKYAKKLVNCLRCYSLKYYN